MRASHDPGRDADGLTPDPRLVVPQNVARVNAARPRNHTTIARCNILSYKELQSSKNCDHRLKWHCVEATQGVTGSDIPAGKDQPTPSLVIMVATATGQVAAARLLLRGHGRRPMARRESAKRRRIGCRGIR